MNWIEILVIVLTAGYLLSMLALYLYRKHHHFPINPCDDAPGPKLVKSLLAIDRVREGSSFRYKSLAW